MEQQAAFQQHSRDHPIINISGEQIALGPLRHELLPHYLRWRNDLYLMRTFGDVPRPVTAEARERWFEDVTTSDEAILFTIYERASWRPIGMTNLFDLDERHRSCAFGMMIGEADCRGRGYGAETAHLMLDYAFTSLALHSVHLDVDEFNLAGRRAYAKAGFREVGRLREATWLAGQWWDLIQMDCLAHEFVSPVLGRMFAPDQPRA